MKSNNYEPLEKLLTGRFTKLTLTENHKSSINSVEKDGFYIYTYRDALDVPKDDPIVKICRGIAIREDGKLMNYPFNRFFNFHEPEVDELEIMESDIIEKFDGTLISLWYDGSNWRVTTRGCFPPSEQGADFGVIFKRLFNQFDKLIPGYTYMFELMSNENPIVTKYDEEFVALIGMRDLDNLQEFNQDYLDEIATQLGVRRPKRFNATCIEDCRALFDKMEEDEEGLVVVDGDFNRFKLKQQSYLKMARIMSLKDQDILDYVLGKSEIDADFDKMPEVKKRIDEVTEMYNLLEDNINIVFNKIEEIKSQKEFALEALKHPFSGILFQLRKGVLFENVYLKYKQIEFFNNQKAYKEDNINNNMKKEHELKICGKCGNKRIRVVIGDKGMWECDCGWKGSDPVIQIISIKEYLEFAEDILE